MRRARFARDRGFDKKFSQRKAPDLPM
jgi:hypothetical protein